MKTTSNKMIRTIAVTSGKGGVGKTSFTVNLAVGLSKLNKKVLILDADLGLSNIDIMLNITTKYHIGHLLSGEKKIEELIVEGPHGIKLLPASAGIQELTTLDQSQRLKFIEALDSYTKDIDVLLIDTGAGISKNVAFFCMAAQEIIVLTTPEPTAITDAYAIIKVLFTKHKEKNFKILVNSVKDSKEAQAVYKNLSTVTEKFLNISLDYVGFLPYTRSASKAVRAQKAIIDLYPDSDLSKCLMKIATNISSTQDDPRVKGTPQFFLGNLLKGNEDVHSCN
jgi:flagellar biosynthesis protein FlhG